MEESEHKIIVKYQIEIKKAKENKYIEDNGDVDMFYR